MLVTLVITRVVVTVMVTVMMFRGMTTGKREMTQLLVTQMIN